MDEDDRWIWECMLYIGTATCRVSLMLSCSFPFLFILFIQSGVFARIYGLKETTYNGDLLSESLLISEPLTRVDAQSPLGLFTNYGIR